MSRAEDDKDRRRLFSHPQTFKLHKILKAMRQAIKIHFTMKMRIGWDENSINAREVAKIAEAEGVDALFVHGRTRTAGYSGKVNLADQGVRNR